MTMQDVPVSPADIDFYFLVTSQLFWRLFPTWYGRYRMWSRKRNHLKIDKRLKDSFEREVIRLSTLPFPTEVADYVAAQHPELTPDFINWLKNSYRIRPERFEYVEQDGIYEIFWNGPLHEIVLYESTVMAALLQENARANNLKPKQDWQNEARSVAHDFVKHDIRFVIGGLRRRLSYPFERDVTALLAQECGDMLRSTSNIRIAAELNLWTAGTAPHVAIQAHAARYGYPNANFQFLLNWTDVYLHGFRADRIPRLGTFLTDTFTSATGLRDLERFESAFPDRQGLIRALRNDSMNPEDYAAFIGSFMHSSTLVPRPWTIVHSDSLKRDTAIAAAEATRKHGLLPLFIIGTYITHELAGHKGYDVAAKCETFWTVEQGKVLLERTICKLSDNPEKRSGPDGSVERALTSLGIG